MDMMAVEQSALPDPPADVEGRAPGVGGLDRGAGTLRKAVDALAIVPHRQRIYPLGRKLFNVLLYLAQQQGLEKDVYRVTLSDLMGKAKFNSNDRELIKNHLRQMNSTQVEWQSPTANEGSRWDVSNLIAHAAIEENGRGRAVVVEWSFAPNIKRELLNPQRFAQISLAFQSSLRTHASIALFEICSRYIDNPSHLTARNPWVWWRPVLTGMPDIDASAYLKYKYFKRDVLTTSIAELNKLTDLQVELIEHRQGRQVQDLQFSVKRKKQQSLALAQRPEFDLALIGRAVRIGVSQMVAENLQEKYGKDVLGEALQITEERLKAPSARPVEKVERYLQGVARDIANQPRQPIAMPEKPVRKEAAPRPNREALEQRFRDDRRREARAVFDDLDSEDQKTRVFRFEQECVHKAALIIRRSYEKGGLSSPAIGAEFSRWLAEQMWGQGWDKPSADELLELAVGE